MRRSSQAGVVTRVDSFRDLLLLRRIERYRSLLYPCRLSSYPVYQYWWNEYSEKQFQPALLCLTGTACITNHEILIYTGALAYLWPSVAAMMASVRVWGP